MAALDTWTVMTRQQEERTGSGGTNMQIREAVMGKTVRCRDKHFPSQMKYRLKTLSKHERTDNNSRRRLHACPLTEISLRSQLEVSREKTLRQSVKNCNKGQGCCQSHLKSKLSGVRTVHTQLLHAVFILASRGALQWLRGNSATTVTHSFLLSVCSSQEEVWNQRKGKMFYSHRNTTTTARHASQQYQGLAKWNKWYKEAISPDEACHTLSLRSACCACSTSGWTYPGASGQSASVLVPEGKRFQALERVKSTMSLSNTFLSPFVFLLFQKKNEKVLWCLWWRMSEAAQPPPLRPPVLSLPTPLLSAFRFCRSSVTDILLFSLSPSLSSLQAG